MNEKGVIIGETTIGGRRELYNDEGHLRHHGTRAPRARARLDGARSHPDHGRVRREVRLRRQRRVPDGRRPEGSVAVRDLRRRRRPRWAPSGRPSASRPAKWACRPTVRASRRSTDDPNFTMYSKNVYDVAEKRTAGGRRASRSSSTALRHGRRPDHAEPPRVARAEPAGAVAEARPVGAGAAVLGEAGQEGHRARPDGHPPRHLRGHAVRPDEQPAGRPVRHAEPLVPRRATSSRPKATRRWSA